MSVWREGPSLGCVAILCILIVIFTLISGNISIILLLPIIGIIGWIWDWIGSLFRKKRLIKNEKMKVVKIILSIILIIGPIIPMWFEPLDTFN